MARVLHEDSEFKVLLSHDFIVVRKGYPREYHSHFKKYAGAMRLIHYFNKQLKPKSEYFCTAMRRITTEEEFDGLRAEKGGN